MKKIIQYLSIVCVLLGTCSICWGKTMTVELTKEPTPDHNNESRYGRRVPPKPVKCFIDFEIDEISFSPELEENIYYELWDASHTFVFYTGTDKSELIAKILEIKQDLQLVVVSDSQSYFGYLMNN